MAIRGGKTKPRAVMDNPPTSATTMLNIGRHSAMTAVSSTSTDSDHVALTVQRQPRQQPHCDSGTVSEEEEEDDVATGEEKGVTLTWCAHGSRGRVHAQHRSRHDACRRSRCPLLPAKSSGGRRGGRAVPAQQSVLHYLSRWEEDDGVAEDAGRRTAAA